MNEEELDILHSYDEKTQLKRSSGYTFVSKEFYDYIQKVLWLSYVEEDSKIEVI